MGMNITLNVPDEVAAHLLHNPVEQQRVADVPTAFYSIPRPPLFVAPPESAATSRYAAMLKPELTLEEEKAALGLLRPYFGMGNSGNPNSADNDCIDADLAR